MPVVPSGPPGNRNEQHRCPHCNSRYEVWHGGDPMGTSVDVEVRCPCCGGPHTISLPRGAEAGARVEALPGPEPDTGGGD
ncbi:MAG TPA: hypothetical protein VFM29_04035 [Vicinamibacteria bacterium]|nr:hypothetical protein [Vicinamibacteria bacterium]